jgi:hypothetical protein
MIITLKFCFVAMGVLSDALMALSGKPGTLGLCGSFFVRPHLVQLSGDQAHAFKLLHTHAGRVF